MLENKDSILIIGYGLNPYPSLIAMLINGCITDVMESFPLQLTVKQGMNSYHVELSDNVIVITEKGISVDPGILKPRLRVTITTSSAQNSSAVVATKIVIR